MTVSDQEPGSGPGRTVTGDITRLNPADGLFLRGEHLQTIQNYARDLAQAVGMANGSGVVYGYTATLDGTTLKVGPGLAINDGLPLKSTGYAEVRLNGIPPSTEDAAQQKTDARSAEHAEIKLTSDLAAQASGDSFLLVRIVSAEWRSGHEKVYGEPCGDGCSGTESAIQPWIREGVMVRLDPVTLDGLGSANSAQRRNRLASLYFERELRNGHSWLIPEDPGQPVEPITRRNWSTGAPQAEPTVGSSLKPSGVPIAALMMVNNEWVLDVWTARRDIGGPVSKRAWQTRLSMRPWNIFMAQVLQFEAQLASHAVALDQLEYDLETIAEVEPLAAYAVQATKSMSDAERKQLPPVVEAAVAALAALPLVRRKTGMSLDWLGFEDLPPAGYLPVSKAAPDLETSVRSMLGDNLQLRFRPCDVDYVPQAVEEAQHRERIPLNRPDLHPSVDIFVPSTSGPGPVGGYGWVAFARQNAMAVEDVPIAGDTVGVYYLGDGGRYKLGDSGITRTPKVKHGHLLGTVTYPHNGWAFPGTPDSSRVISRLAELAPDYNESTIHLLALADSEERRPLVSLRASLLAATFDSGLPAPPIYTIVAEAEQPEAIIIVVTKSSGNGNDLNRAPRTPDNESPL